MDTSFKILQAKTAILIIVHKPILNELEKISIAQAFSIFNKRDIYFIVPSNLNLSFYIKHFPKAFFYKIEEKWLSNYVNFNKFKLQPFLYESFLKYEFVLFYEPDCFIFSDNLDYFASLKLDYIAPKWPKKTVISWFENAKVYPKYLYFFHRITSYKFLNMVGNGGFSLRRTAVFYKLLSKHKNLAEKTTINEDLFISHILPFFNFNFKLAKPNEALKFGFDLNPEKCYEENNYELPMGCHAWFRNDEIFYEGNLKFWVKFIKLNND